MLRAEGREIRGQGNATAQIVATMMPSELGTRVRVVTDLTITGRVAQFGRSVLADVSTKLLDQFVNKLEASVPRPDEVAVGSEAAADGHFSHVRGSDPSPAIGHIDSGIVVTMAWSPAPGAAGVLPPDRVTTE